ERAVISFRQTLDAVARTGLRIEFRGTGFPFPHSVPHSDPEIALAVLIQTPNSTAKSAIIPVTSDGPAADSAELSGGWKREAADPYCALASLEDWSSNGLARKLGVRGQPTILPTCDSFRRADPKSPIARGEQAENAVGREMLARRRLPGDGPHTIEA